MDLNEILKEMEESSKKKTFRNWINNRFPKGYASYNSYYILTHPWEILREWKRQTRWAWQRVFRGWDDRATWSIDYYISKHLLEIVTEYKKDSIGIPMAIFKELDLEEKTLENGLTGFDEEQEKMAKSRWFEILDEIIDGFKNYILLDELSIYRDEKEYKEAEEKYEKGFETFKKYFQYLWN